MAPHYGTLARHGFCAHLSRSPARAVRDLTRRPRSCLAGYAAVALGVEDGQKLRVDSTVVETNIHYPTDATLLWGSVRTITRLVEDLHDKLPNGV